MKNNSDNEKILDELKKTEIDLLKLFIDTCKKLNLHYYVVGGTLLGAVRHKGFIPWDDDIDVAMMRHDYDIWVNEAPKLITDSKYFIQTHMTDKFYPANFAKLRNSETTFIETSLRKLDINHGVFIDVFPLDYYPEKPLKRLIFKINQVRYSSKIFDAYDLEAINYSKRKAIFRRLIGLTVTGSPFSSVIKRERLYRSTNSSHLVANLSGAWGDKEIMPISIYGEGTQLKFEDIIVSAPSQYKKLLTNVYGDYMQLPPVEKRISHHYTEVIDLHKTYKHYRRKKT